MTVKIKKKQKYFNPLINFLTKSLFNKALLKIIYFFNFFELIICIIEEVK